MNLLLALGFLLLVGHVSTFVQTRKEKRGAPAGTKLSSSSREQIGILTVLDAIGIGLMVIFFGLTDLRWYMILLYFLAGLLLAVLLVALVSQWFTRLRFLAWLACALLVTGCFWGILRNDRYIESITLREGYEYGAWAPFREDSRVYTMDEPAALRFTEDDALPRMDGTDALYPVYAAFCRAVYPDSLGEKSAEDLDAVISCSTTAGALKALVDGERDIVFVAVPGQEQEEYAQKKNVELVYTPIGREALVFFVHPDNPVQGLSPEQLRGVYSGRLQSWETLGAAELGNILAYQRDESSDSQSALRLLVMGDEPLMKTGKQKILSTAGIVEQVVAYQNRPNAIGYSLRFYCCELERDVDVRTLEIDGVAPTKANIGNDSYPLTVPLYAVTRADADENTLALLDWIGTEQGQTLVEMTGYTPIVATP